MLTDIVCEISKFPNESFMDVTKLYMELEKYIEDSGENPLRCVRDISIALHSAGELSRVKLSLCKAVLINTKRGKYGKQQQ